MSLGRVTAIVLALATALLFYAHQAWPDPEPATSSYGQSGRPPADPRADYIDSANDVCRGWLAKEPKLAKGASQKAGIKWNQTVADLWTNMLQDWAEVRAPEQYAGQVSDVLEAQNDALAAFVDLKEAWREGVEYSWTEVRNQRFDAAKVTFNRRSATAVQRARAFGFGSCAAEWVRWT